MKALYLITALAKMAKMGSDPIFQRAAMSDRKWGLTPFSSCALKG
jgi:hypothetical protein